MLVYKFLSLSSDEFLCALQGTAFFCFMESENLNACDQDRQVDVFISKSGVRAL